MRWEELFGDLEAQAAAGERAELDAEVADRARRETARLRIVDRLRAAHGTGGELTVDVRGLDPLDGRVAAVGSDWMLLACQGVEVVVPVAALTGIRRHGATSADPASEGPVDARLGLGHALRAVARDRSEVVVTTLSGESHSGTIDRVGQDYLEVMEHPAGEPRSRIGLRLVPFAALAAVRLRSADSGTTSGRGV